jgi:fatty-acyl-CoA synthase
MTQAHIAADETLTLRDWTVGDLLRHAAQSAPDQVAVKQWATATEPALQWTYAELWSSTRRLAASLLTHFEPGENVALWGANSAAWMLYQLAAAQAGLVIVTLNPALRGREVETLLRQSKAVGLITDVAYRGTDLFAIASEVKPRLDRLRVILRTGDWASHIADAPEQLRAPAIAPDHPALILFTSGTTGAPKGVVLSHKGIVNNAMMGSERYALEDGVAWLGVLPFFHVGGAVTSTLGCIARLGTNIVVPAFEAELVLSLIEREQVAWFPCVPTMIIALLDHEKFTETDLSSLRLVLTGGTVITPDFVKLLHDRFNADVQVMFGQTESGGGMTKTYRGDPIDRIAATVGRPYPHTEMRIADPVTGATLPTGSAGEVRIRSPFMTREYFDNAAATKAAFDDLGFLRTGDLGSLDALGYLRIHGRLKEMIIRGGENIYPREVEDALAEFDGIVESAVVGVPHPRWGEEVAAAIRCRSGMAVEPDRVRDFLLDRIARHKVPKLWRIVADFPRTPSGKVQKFEVVRWFSDPQ